jgi:transcriptional antiterminator RfaH
MNDEACWYAVQTKPRHEERVLRRLQGRRDLSVFLPRLEDFRRRRSRQRVTTIEPLFPSYLFVQMALEPEPWCVVRWTPGVKQILCTGDVPTPVPADAIRIIRGRCWDSGVVRLKPAMLAGGPIRVVDGPFEGLHGVLERPTGRGERVRVLLGLMGYSMTSVEMDVTDVEFVA